MNYEELIANEKSAPTDLLRMFKRAGGEIAQSWVEKAKRQNGISFKSIFFVFADSQKVELRVKQSGDIYQVFLNSKILPIKEQDDEKAAAAEIVKAVETNAGKFQAKLARQKVKLPTGIKSTIKRKEEAYAERLQELDVKIAEAKEVLAGLA